MTNHHSNNNHFVISYFTNNAIITDSISPVGTQVSRQGFTCIPRIFKQHNPAKILCYSLGLGLI